MERNLRKTFREGLTTSNQVFVALLGMCPVLAVSTSIDNAIGMSMAVLLVLSLSNITISLIRKIVPDEIRIPVFIILIASFVSVLDFFMNAFTPTLYASLGVFIPLIVVNCIILGRAEAFAYKNDVLSSFTDAAGSAIGYGGALFILAFVREVLAKQSLTITNPFNISQFATLNLIEGAEIAFFGTAPGAFITLGLLVAGINVFVSYRAKKAALAKKATAASAKPAAPAVASKAGE
jgi:Na+-translocating ferredoxin:NAD+ oxidoreductase subunit E